MFNRAKAARKRSVRPILVLDTLESRQLMSADISALRAASQAHVSILATLPNAPTAAVSTVPSNGDVNPYGVALVPAGFAKGGVLHPNDVLVSNFNNSANLQGTGTTIVATSPNGTQSVFYQGPPGVGLDGGLVVLKKGYVIVAGLPSTDGTSATAGQGGLYVIDKSGHLVGTLADPNLLNGPWGLTVIDHGSTAQLFVSNALSGTITRLNLKVLNSGGVEVTSAVQIGSGFVHHGDPNAFEIGPGGMAYNPGTGNLYVASEGDDSIYAIHNARHTNVDQGTGRLVVQDNTNMHGPVGLTLADDGHLIVANSDGFNPNPADPSTLAEYTRSGQFIGSFSINPNLGAAFGVTITNGPRPFLFATNDVTAQLQVWHVHGTQPIA